MKDKIIEYSKQIGIDEIGFTNADISETLQEKLCLQKSLGFECEFQVGDIGERTDPKKLMTSCETIIAVLISYHKTCDKFENLGDREVYFSSSSWGEDYHKVLKGRMLQLTEYIKECAPDLEYKIVVDTSVLCDRTIAYNAGLGFFGKNNLLINEKHGSYVFLGAILTNLNLEKDTPLTRSCVDCNKCVDACPSGALSEKGILDSKKCLAYITQKKGNLNDAEKNLLNNCIYGCDICQRVCPHNLKIKSKQEVFLPTGAEFINIDEYVPMSNRKFKQAYGHLSGSWRGPKIINRNISVLKDKLD